MSQQTTDNPAHETKSSIMYVSIQLKLYVHRNPFWVIITSVPICLLHEENAMEPTVPDDRRQRRNCGMHGLRFPRCPLIIIDSSSHKNVNPSGQFNKNCVFCKNHVLTCTQKQILLISNLILVLICETLAKNTGEERKLCRTFVNLDRLMLQFDINSHTSR